MPKEKEAKTAQFINISGRLLRDANGKDWSPLKKAELDPDHHITKGMLAYGQIRLVEDEAAPRVAAATSASAPTAAVGPLIPGELVQEPGDVPGNVASVRPTHAPVPLTNQAVDNTPELDTKTATSGKGRHK